MRNLKRRGLAVLAVTTALSAIGIVGAAGQASAAGCDPSSQCCVPPKPVIPGYQPPKRIKL